jgi:D-tyrosyl-tRNA(Tyr) deacylase
VRAVLQRVCEASVIISGAVKASIGAGLVVLVAVEPTDTSEDIEWLAGKIVRMRIFNDEQGLMNRSILETGGDIVAVSQFTLFASTRKGNRPSWSRAAPPETAVPLYQTFVAVLARQLAKPIQTGEFGADMKITLTNDGPVTILIDSRLRE